MILILGFFTLGLAAENVSPNFDQQKNNVDYINTFNSLGDLYTNYYNIGLLPAKDLENILNFLKSKGVDTNGRMPRLTEIEGAMSAGSFRIKIQNVVDIIIISSR
jgi:hypothetical protein